MVHDARGAVGVNAVYVHGKRNIFVRVCVCVWLCVAVVWCGAVWLGLDRGLLT